MSIAYRFDRAAPLYFDELPSSPTRTRATLTPEGYLVADAYIARDGLLRYTAADGTSWIEYRPRVELERAAASWRPGTPVTDDHPRVMVNADTWVGVAKGVHLDTGVVEIVDGVGYIRSRLQITDRALVAKIRGDASSPSPGTRKVQVSIGFATDVVPCPSGAAPDGTRCDAMQTMLVANHTAVVDRGRAGPSVRILDASGELRDHPCYDQGASTTHAPKSKAHNVTKIKPTTKTAKPARLVLDTAIATVIDLRNVDVRASKIDEGGAPTDEVEIIGPDGEPLTVQTWIAAALAEWQSMKAQAAMQAAQGGAATAPAPAPAAVPAPAADAPPAPAPAAEAPKPDEEKDKPMDAAAITRATRDRARLERLAAKAGIADAVIDSADDDDLRKVYVEKVIPKIELDALRVRLDDAAIVEVAAARPVATVVSATAPVRPAPKPMVRGTATKADAESDTRSDIDELVYAEALHMTREGIA